MIQRRNRPVAPNPTACRAFAATATLLLAVGTTTARSRPSACDTTTADPPAAALTDTLDAFWRSLDPPWYEPLTVHDLDFGLTDAGLDSLTDEGDHVIAGMQAGRPWRLAPSPLARLRFNRAEGPVVGGDVTLTRAGTHQPRLVAGLDYGFAWRRCTHDHRLELPLRIARLRDDAGRLVRAPWVLLALEAAGGRTIDRFGGDRRPLDDPSALFAGDDPSQYFEHEQWRVALRCAPHPATTLRLGYGAGAQRPLGTRTTWSLFGDPEDVGPDVAALPLHRRSWTAEAIWRRRGLELSAAKTWHRVTDAPLPALAADRDAAVWFGLTRFTARWSARDARGNTWLARGEWHDVDRPGAPQWRTHLGGYGTLHGEQPDALVGERAAWAVAEFLWNRRLGFLPDVSFLRFQPLLHAEWGRAWPVDGPSRQIVNLGGGLNADLGLGGAEEALQLLLVVPVAGEGAGVRFAAVVSVR